MKLLTRRGVLVEEQGQAYLGDIDADSDESRVLRPLQAAACTYRIAFGPRAGQKVLTVLGVMPRETDFKQNLCADSSGFSLHAAVRCGADERQALELLCRYIARPALADARQPADRRNPARYRCVAPAAAAHAPSSHRRAPRCAARTAAASA